MEAPVAVPVRPAAPPQVLTCHLVEHSHVLIVLPRYQDVQLMVCRLISSMQGAFSIWQLLPLSPLQTEA
jgi:hypothetical protein